MLELVLGTIFIRPYVFVFLIAYVVIGSVQMGWRRMVVFSVIGFLFGFGSEALSQRIGFPYGPYEYLGYTTRGKELWALNVPLMASLSFIFMNYAGLLMAMTAIGRFDERAPGMRFVDFTATLHMPALLLLAPLFTTVLDIVIDPVALQGKEWFLGELYTYHEEGFYFGVPFSNFAGWYIVSFLILATFRAIDRWLDLGGRGATVKGNKPVAWLGVGLYAGILVFNVTVQYAIGQTGMGLISTLISLVALGVVAMRFIPERASD